MAWMAPILVLAGGVEMTTLEGQTWQLVSIVHADGKTHAVPDGVKATATFANGVVSGSNGCNRYTTSYTVKGGTLTLVPAASTMMACPDPAATVERSFATAWAATTAYRIENEQLLLLNASGQTVATFNVQKQVALVGGTWQATFYNNGRDAAVSVLDGSQITATFSAAGQLSGSAGCNQYRAAYVIKGAAITIEAPATTRMTCANPKGVMQQESEYLKALPTAATYSVQGDQLELRTDKDALVASFQVRSAAPAKR